MQIKEKELIEKSIQGDEKAFEQLVSRTQEHVYFHCLKIVKDEEIAEDLTQETFLHAYQHLPSFQMKSSFSTWIWRIAHNLCLNYLKKKHFQEIELNEEITPSPKEKEIGSEVFMENLQKALATLPEKYRIVFEMYDLKQLPQKQIAAMLNIPHGTVRSRLHYARKKIKEFFIREKMSLE